MADPAIVPRFPRFRGLEIRDRESISGFVACFPPYSDFDSFSLWSWDTSRTTQISTLNGNLVVRFQDYCTSEPFYSFLGNRQVLETVDTLLAHSAANGLPQRLRLIPEHNLLALHPGVLEACYQVEEDRDNFDYILAVETLVNMGGSKRRRAKRFHQRYEPRVLFGSPSNASLQADIRRLVGAWSVRRAERGKVNAFEMAAIGRALTAGPLFNAILLAVYVEEELRGFIAYQVVGPDYALNSFQKADTSFDGIVEFMRFQQALHLQGLGVRYINIEQDLGLPGLRAAKSAYEPSFLRKYTIAARARSVGLSGPTGAA